MHLNIKIPMAKCRGEYVVEIGSQIIRHRDKDTLNKMVCAMLDAAAYAPQVALVHVGDSVSVLVQHVDSINTYVKTDASQQGVCTIRHTSSSNCIHDDLAAQSRTQAIHVARCNWNDGDAAPDWLTDDERKDWDRWQRFVLAYKLARECGYNSQQAHALACEVY